MSNVRIELTQGGRGLVWVDGTPLHNLLRGFTLTAAVGETPTLRLDLIAVDVDLEADGVEVEK